MFCSSCGSALSPGAMHCGNCGSAVARTSQPTKGYAQPDGQPYGQPAQPGFDQYPQQPYYNSPVPASGRAIASLALSLLGISLIGLILGYSARKEIRNSQGRLSGDGMALAGIIIGWIGSLGWVLIWALALSAGFAASYYY